MRWFFSLVVPFVEPTLPFFVFSPVRACEEPALALLSLYFLNGEFSLQLFPTFTRGL